MKFGVIDQVGTGAELYAPPATLFVGDSDFLPYHVLEVHGDRAKVQIGDVVIASPPVHGTALPVAATLMLRPERIMICAWARSGEHAVAATVRDITFLGASVHVAAEVAAAALVSVRIPYGHPSIADAQPDRTVWLDFAPEAAHCFG